MPVIALLAVTILGTAASANETIEDALGGPFITCTGAIAWAEADRGAPRVEPMRLAVRDAEGAAAIGLFLSEDEFASDNVWACADGICTAHSSSHSAVTTNVLRLRHEADLVGEEAIYQLAGVFVVVNARQTPIDVESAQGIGSFICEEALPESLVSVSNEDNSR